jgi:hypothetical protein
MTKHYIIQYISDMTKLSFKSQLEFSLDSIWWIQRIQNTLILYTLSLLIIYAFFPLISQRGMFSTNRLKNISQCEVKSILLATDKNNSISLNIWTKHYHQYHYQFVLSVILVSYLDTYYVNIHLWGLGLWCLKPLSTIFQLYRGSYSSLRFFDR